MLVVAAKITVKPGKREDFIEATRDLVAKTRAEQGNISYTLYASTENRTDLMFYELWTNQAALDAHMRTPHFVAFGKYLDEHAVAASPIDIKVHAVAD